MSEQTQVDSQEQTVTLDEQINAVLATADKDTGKIKFDEGVDPLFKKAVLGEQKARVHQANYTKSRQEIAKLTAKATMLESQLTSNTQLTAEQVEELEELKYKDLDAWYIKRAQYEEASVKAVAGKLQELADEAANKAIQDLTLSERKDALVSFQEATGIVLTDDIMENDVPQRLKNQINDMPFPEYLKKVATYLGKGKVIKQTDATLDQTNINTLTGSSYESKTKKVSYQIL